MTKTSTVAAKFGRLVAEARAEAGLSQTTVAERAGLSRSTVARYEAGTREPMLAEALRLARALRFSLDDVLA